jgi:hypothetical protein
MERTYNPDIRENDPFFLRRNVQELLLIGNANKNSSSVIYACLDSRIALEKLDLTVILLSVDEKERNTIIEETKPKNGIERVGQKIGVLKERYQLFFQAVCEVLDIDSRRYDFKKSKDLQIQLSAYIHSYYMTNEDLKYDSQIMQNAIRIITDVDKFILSSYTKENETYGGLTGIKIATIASEDKLLLNEWKLTKTLDYEDLKLKIKQNFLNSQPLKTL